ncbi:MAG: hypothetical protein ACOH2H_18635 [Cypionkella sp.]
MSDIRPAVEVLRSGDAADTPPFVSLRKIAKAFGATLANAEINLDVRAGDVIGLDKPTSSVDLERSQQLRAYMHARSR